MSEEGTIDDAPEIAALRAELARDPGLARKRADEIWVRARVDEILAEGRPRPLRKALGTLQLLTFDAAAAALCWWVLDPGPVVPLFGLALSKVLVVALAAAAAHVAATLNGALSLAHR